MLSPIRKERLLVGVSGSFPATEAGTKSRCLNTINFKKSMHYNPFAYIRSEKDILKLVNTLIANTKGEGEKSGEDFWVKAERLFYCALIGYIWYEAPEDGTELYHAAGHDINASEAREDDEEFTNARWTCMFARAWKNESPEHFAVQAVQKVQAGGGQDSKKPSSFPAVRGLLPLTFAELRELMAYDEMELDTLGRPKDGAVCHYLRYRRHLQLCCSTSFIRSFSICFVTRRMMFTAGGCLYHVRVLLGRVCQHRADTEVRKADCHHPKPRDISASIILQSPEPVKGHLQG